MPFDKTPPQWQLFLFWVTRGVYPDDLKWCLLHTHGIRKVAHIRNQSDWATLQMWAWPWLFSPLLPITGVFLREDNARSSPNPVWNQGYDWQTECWKLFCDSGRIFLHWPLRLTNLKEQIILEMGDFQLNMKTRTIQNNICWASCLLFVTSHQLTALVHK